MNEDRVVSRANLRTPRAAAVAGLIFSVLLLAVFGLMHMFVPAEPSESGAWLKTSSRAVALALNLVPFAGAAFLWFIGVLRDRLGPLEDRFFATVFLGSGLLFLAMLFIAAAIVGALIVTSDVASEELANSAAFHIARAAAYNVVNIYMMKMAAVFMVSLSTVVILTGIAWRPLALLGYALAVVLLFGTSYVGWAVVLFPIWVFLLSVYILIDNYRALRVQDATLIARGDAEI
jgi:hypothetical protein